MADVQSGGEGAIRAAEALLRGTGGRSAWLRLPVPAVAGDEAEQMGLATPLYNDVELAPFVFRRTGRRRELLVSAAAVMQVVGSLEFDSAKVLFTTAAGVVVGDELLEVDEVTPVEAQGAAVCYRVALKA